jgi:hypothetical protein
MSVGEFTLRTQIFFDQVTSSPPFRRANHGLHSARFARPYELAPLISHTLTDTEALHLGVWDGNRPISVRPTLTRPELGNLAVVARTRGGKGHPECVAADLGLDPGQPRAPAAASPAG